MSNKITSLSEVLTEACFEMMGMFGISPVFVKETENPTLNTKRYIYITIELSLALSGTIVIGLQKDFAWKLMSHMMGGMEVNELDMIAQSSLCEFTNMLAGSALIKLNSPDLIDLSPPVIEINDSEAVTVIAEVPSKKLNFEIDDAEFHIDDSKFEISYIIKD